jgi:hypothetical protein
MRGRNVRRAAGGAALLLAACVANPAPSGWLPPAEVAAREAYGGWIVAETAPDALKGVYVTGTAGGWTGVEGELIAVDPDTVFVLREAALVALPKTAVRNAQLFAYDAQWGGLAWWGVIGTLSTISNGGFLLLTAPLWIITSTATTASRSRAPRVELAEQGDRWAVMRLYARFPPGLPPGLDRQSLRPSSRQSGAKGTGK